jgi:hypothetical protein
MACEFFPLLISNSARAVRLSDEGRSQRHGGQCDMVDRPIARERIKYN